MRKFYVFKFVCVCLFLVNTAEAAMTDGDEYNSESIYFCTKDLDVLHSVAIENPANSDMSKGRYCAANNLDNDLLTKFRHCFLMFARKINGNDDFYYLETDHALFGYGSENSGLSTSKQGKARAEILEPGTSIACVPVLNQNDIRNKLAHDGKEKKMFYWWTTVQNYMDEDASNNLYDTFSHNCCTVASDAIKKVGGHLEKINFANFNEGYGTIDKEGASLLKFVGLSGTFSSEVSGRVGRFLFKSSDIVGSKICQNSGKKDKDNIQDEL